MNYLSTQLFAEWFKKESLSQNYDSIKDSLRVMALTSTYPIFCIAEMVGWCEFIVKKHNQQLCQ